MLKKFLLTGAAVSTLAALAAPAQAGLIMRLTDDVGSVITIVDNGAGDTNAAVGQIDFDDGTLSISSQNQATQTSGVAPAPIVSVHANTQAVGTTTGTFPLTLLLELTVTDLSLDSFAHIFSSISNTSLNTTVAYTSWVDLSNAAFGHATQLFTATNSSPGSAQSNNVSMMLDASFSLTQQYLITMNAGGDSNVNGSMEIRVPEPALMGLFGLGLGALGVMRRRRKA